MKNILAMFLALGLLVTSAHRVLAQDSPAADAPAATSVTVEGKVTNIDTANNKITVDTPQGSMTFKETGNLPTLSEGTQVKVTYSGSGDNMIADNVEVVSAEAAPAPDTTTAAPSETPPADTTTDTTTTETTTTETTHSMPHTASPLPLVGLSGLAAFGAALALRLKRK